ncbi:unnamed protein product [Blepharisma stoltei]|uniref:DNA topoisomerase n=1 Tax=Blepharisma stoltei TaxID=1481888 RepID=A0AAU9IAL5_9CILI|nr:unnamed protein product [Blepharisma stoltei]
MSGVLMVAEKPSIAKSIAEALGGNNVEKRQGASKICPVYEYNGRFFDEPAHFIVTSVAGHLFSTDFPKRFNNWNEVDPISLYDAETLKIETSMKGGNLIKHLQNEAKRCKYLVLWLDCDREGENICFEVMSIVEDYMQRSSYQWVYRAKFSSLTTPDLRKAMMESNLVAPNKNESDSVDARQELDLKIGASFTRFQTQFFQGKYGDLDSKLISYGPCQTPTLGFCVKRHDEIVSFKPEPYYVLSLSTRTSPPTKPKYAKGHIKHAPSGEALLKKLNELKNTPAIVRSVQKSSHKTKKPSGLNTVHMLKLASSILGLGPQAAMSAAERLYLSGYITYPRTESTAYAPSFNLHEVISIYQRHPQFGEHAQMLLNGGFKKPHKGIDAGDHPPITPCGSAGQLSGTELSLYNLISRHFLATVSQDATFQQIDVLFDYGGEQFKLKGSRTVNPGFSAMTPWACANDREIPEFTEGQEVPVAGVELSTEYTSPPGYLTESELLSLMEANGIGTDASMSAHINNICERNYVKVESNSRRLIPTQLGIRLVHGYYAVDKDLVLPKVRSEIEKSVSSIAKGEAQKEFIVNRSVDIFKQKFAYFRENIANVDQLFEAYFSPLAQSQGKPFTKCGKCFRFMNYLPLRPCRLYCPNCEMTYKLPQNCTIKPYKEQKCPLDHFEILIVKNNNFSYLICPNCFSDPPFEGIGSEMSCMKCPQYDCENNMAKHVITACPKCENDMTINGLLKPNWSLICVFCKFSINMFEGASSVVKKDINCEECGSFVVKVKYNNNSPWEAGEMEGCLWCNSEMAKLVDYREGTEKDENRRGDGRGHRGRGHKGRGHRGRGGRSRGRGGRGRGRGKQNQQDKYLSFEDF